MTAELALADEGNATINTISGIFTEHCLSVLSLGKEDIRKRDPICLAFPH